MTVIWNKLIRLQCYYHLNYCETLGKKEALLFTKCRVEHGLTLWLYWTLAVGYWHGYLSGFTFITDSLALALSSQVFGHSPVPVAWPHPWPLSFWIWHWHLPHQFLALWANLKINEKLSVVDDVIWWCTGAAQCSNTSYNTGANSIQSNVV